MADLVNPQNLFLLMLLALIAYCFCKSNNDPEALVESAVGGANEESSEPKLSLLESDEDESDISTDLLEDKQEEVKKEQLIEKEMEEVEETVPKNSSMDDKTTIVGYEESPFHNFTASTDTKLTPNELMPGLASGEKNYITSDRILPQQNSCRPKSHEIRSTPAIPKIQQISPWLNSSIDPCPIKGV